MTERVETKRDLEHLLKSNDAFIFDCDGVLWRGHTPLPGAVEFLHRLEKMGKKVFYLTNNSLITRQDMYKAVTGMGYPGQVVSLQTCLVGCIVLIVLFCLNRKTCCPQHFSWPST